MEMVYDLLKIIVPASLVVYVSYLIVRSFHNKQLDELALNIRQKNQEVVIPIRLQAYERVIILLERISPANIIPRLNSGDYTAAEFQHILIHEIRNEFNHNISQQVYMSDSAWTYVKTAVEQVISLINSKVNTLPEEAKSFDLSKAILQENENSIEQAIKYVKEEIQTIF